MNYRDEITEFSINLKKKYNFSLITYHFSVRKLKDIFYLDCDFISCIGKDNTDNVFISGLNLQTYVGSFTKFRQHFLHQEMSDLVSKWSTGCWEQAYTDEKIVGYAIE